jgi:tetratricopeptide (TPR) repeat protein
LVSQLALALASTCALAQTGQAAPLDDLRRQIEASQFEQAWATADANPQLLGNVHFDFLYGVAAINVGRVPEGLLALERHLAAVPANDRARLELARGYFLLGEYTRARAEFEFVLRYNPPAGVRSTIAGYLQAMQARESADRRTTARFYAEVGGGHDNNVNGGTYRDQIQLFGGPINLLAGPSRQVSDDFAQAAVGGQRQLRVDGRLSVFAGADLDHRANFKQKDYDLTSAGAYIGFSQLAARALWRLTLGSSELRVGGDRYRDTFQVSLEANVTPSTNLALLAFSQYSEARHAAADEARDARSTTLGGMLTYNFSGAPGAPSAGVRISATQEQNTRLRSDLSRDVGLIRLFGSISALERLRLSLGVTAFEQHFGNTDIVFGNTRKDHTVSVDGVANYTIDPRWSLRADGVWSRNRSNQQLYDSGRKSVSLKLRYQY